MSVYKLILNAKASSLRLIIARAKGSLYKKKISSQASYFNLYPYHVHQEILDCPSPSLHL